MQIHVVSSGETLFSIARQYDVPAGILARYNGLAEPYRLAVGQSLLILAPDESCDCACGRHTLVPCAAERAVRPQSAPPEPKSDAADRDLSRPDRRDRD